jgi:hypothetical protein
VEPLDERLIRFQHPKRPSTVHRPISESRSVPLGKSPRCFGDPKNPSATRRPASLHRVEPVSELPARVQAPKSSFPNHHLTSKPREAVKQASRPHPSSEELFSDPSARSRAPGGTFRRASNCLKPPKRPSTGRRLAFQPRGTFQRASAPPSGSEEPLSNTSTSFPAPGGTFRQASVPRPDSEESINSTSTSLPAPWNRSPSVWPTSSLRRDLPQVVDPTPSSGWSASASFKDTSRLRRTRQRLIDPNLNSGKLITARHAHLRVPKNPSSNSPGTQSFQRTLQRTPDLLQESEDSFSKALSRFRGLRECLSKLLAPV